MYWASGRAPQLLTQPRPICACQSAGWSGWLLLLRRSGSVSFLCRRPKKRWCSGGQKRRTALQPQTSVRCQPCSTVSTSGYRSCCRFPVDGCTDRTGRLRSGCRCPGRCSGCGRCSFLSAAAIVGNLFKGFRHDHLHTEAEHRRYLGVLVGHHLLSYLHGTFVVNLVGEIQFG